ncbi:MAG: hypothetical protein M1381_06025 [Deltaproteobacteria bacterium]|nr:hypothetical protein [Deltaproteobacteria bacterium]
MDNKKLLVVTLSIFLYVLLIHPYKGFGQTYFNGNQNQPIQQYEQQPMPTLTGVSPKALYEQGFTEGTAIALKAFSGTTATTPAFTPNLTIQGLPNQFSPYGVAPDGVVLRLTSGAINALQTQLANLLTSEYMIKYIGTSLNGENFAGDFCWATANWTCPFGCLGSCGSCSGGTYTPNGCGDGPFSPCSYGGSCCADAKYGVQLTDDCQPSGCPLPAGDGILMYYDKANVTLAWSPNTCPGGVPTSLNIGIQLYFDGNTPSWASQWWPNNCPDSNWSSGPGSAPLYVGDINYRADISIVGTLTGNGYAAVNNISINATATPSFTSATTAWGPDTYFSFPPGSVHVNSVSLPGFYVQALNWSCSIFGWNPCQSIATWINGLVSGYLQGTVQSTIQNALNTQLPTMLNSGLGLPLDINKLLGEPLNLSTNCYLFGAYPDPAGGLYGDCYGVKFPLDFGLLPAIYTPYYTSNSASCDKSCVDMTSFNPTNVLLTNPPTTGVKVAANVFNSTTVPSGTYLFGGSTHTIQYAGQPYDLGIGMSQDVLNELLYDIYLSGLACIDININTYPSLASYLNINAFARFAPAIAQIADPNSYVSISLIPRSSGTNNPPPTSLQLGRNLSETFTSGTLTTSMIYAALPNYQIDFYAQVGGVQQRMFTLNWNLQAGADISYLVPTPLPPSTYGALMVNFLLVPKITQVTNIYPGITQDMVHGIAQIIPVLLSTVLGGYIQAPINLGALGINVGFYYIGPDPNALDADADGTPDFLSAYAYAYGPLNWQGILGAPRYQALMQNGAPHAYILVPDGQDIGKQTSGPVVLNTLNVNGIQSKMLGISSSNTVINYAGYDPMNYNAQLEYTYRLDDGLWSPFTTSTEATLPVLTEGVHTFEVMAKNKGNFSDLTPACLTFRVDTVPPAISVTNMQNGATTGTNVELDLKVSDYQTPSDEIAVAYSLDGSPSKSLGSSRQILLSFLSPGKHSVIITATDASDNTSTLDFSFATKSSSSSGCAWLGTQGTSGSSGIMFLLIPLTGIGFLILRRRLVLQRHRR